MEKAKVLLVPSHHAFNHGHATYEELLATEGLAELDESMLTGFICTWKEALEGPFRKDYEACLGALLQLTPFTAVVSMRFDLDPVPHLRLAKRDWCLIFYDGRLVANFTHSREDQRPFDRLYEWMGVPDASIDAWRQFFMQRIREEAEERKAFAEKEAEQAQAVIAYTNRVLVELLAAA